MDVLPPISARKKDYLRWTALMIKINGRRLRFDVAKAYCPAIRSAIERMPAGYKKLCDQYLQEWVGLSPKAQ
jgi:hypothetical protein